jgi:hypothetical protein
MWGVTPIVVFIERYRVENHILREGKMMRPLLVSVFSGCLLAAGVPVGDSDGLARHGHQLLQLLEKTKGSDELASRLRNVLHQEKIEEFPERLHKALGSSCLILVTINPESRVKAARGDAPARLRRNVDTVFLIRVQNEAGVTHPLKVTISEGTVRWLKTHIRAVSAKGLSGAGEEYVILQLAGRDTGKREATLTFDVGQGTQDLGFRAEVPVLFTID